MNAAGLWDDVNDDRERDAHRSDDDEFDINDYVGMRRVMGITMLVAAVDVVLITALATLGAFIYNMAASLLGGIEVTLAEDITVGRAARLASAEIAGMLGGASDLALGGLGGGARWGNLPRRIPTRGPIAQTVRALP